MTRRDDRQDCDTDQICCPREPLVVLVFVARLNVTRRTGTGAALRAGLNSIIDLDCDWLDCESAAANL